ncbi:hypothetical protein CPB86DRAFT_869906 [Serendipita vermifera]|nr:hypothetical protein CPB86DRAFT_869906 [Serendipita vermifera]
MFRNSRASGELSGDNSDAGSDVENKHKASPASRLRAAMNRLGHSSPPRRRTPLVSESDSDLNPVFSARKSLKDVFSRAMRDTRDSPDAQSLNGGLEKHEDSEDGAIVSDSSLPLSSQATSLQLLKQRLDLPEMSSRLEASRSAARLSTSNQDLHSLLKRAEADSMEDISIETAKATVPNFFHGEEGADYSLNSRSGNYYSKEQEGTTGNRTVPHNEPHSQTPSPSRSPVIGDTTDPHITQLPGPKTPKPPGGWFTPVRPGDRTANIDASSYSYQGRTPAPPGGWRNSPSVSASREMTSKVRFRENELQENTSQVLADLEAELSLDIASTDNAQRAVKLVDSFGRERKFDEAGQEIIPLASSPKLDQSLLQRSASVRIVDSMGNHVDTSATPSAPAQDQNALVTTINSQIVTLKNGLDKVEARHAAHQHRRINKQPITIPHDRILELAMESREARIEREKLLRQSHLVRARDQELSLDLKKLKEQAPVDSKSPVPTQKALRWPIIVILLLFFVLLWLSYSYARAYIRHYFLTDYYDPFFSMVDPVTVRHLPFLQTIVLPGDWKAFTTHGAGQAILRLLPNLGVMNKRILALVTKSVENLAIRLPS